VAYEYCAVSPVWYSSVRCDRFGQSVLAAYCLGSKTSVVLPLVSAISRRSSVTR
jgi:hypothetical protein